MSRMLLIPLGAASALVLSMFGCGGVGGADGLFDQGSVGAGGVPSTTSSVTTSTTVTTSGATTSNTTSSSSDTTSTSVTSGSSTSSASGSSSSTGGVSDMLACGNATCPLGNQNACCWSKFGMPAASGTCVQGPPESDGCKTFVAGGGLQSRLECQISAQCDQGVCCGHRIFYSNNNQQSFFYDLVSCLDTCDPSDVTLCDPANPADICPMIATQNGPVQGVCMQSSSLPPGYFVCSAPG
jgi:hypothetical protein